MTLEQILESYYQAEPEARDIHQWAGCNYYVGQGRHELEPVGTAQSMHECTGCEHISYCKMIQATPVWEWSEEKRRWLSEQWAEMIKAKRLGNS